MKVPAQSRPGSPFIAAAAAAAAVAALAAMATAEAAAEPQILGLVASNTVTPLICADGTCSAEVTSFCMEPERASPYHETKYVAARTADLTLVATAADGTQTRIAAAERLEFASERGFAAVRISLPEQALADLGAVRVGLVVGPGSALLPDTKPDANGRHSAQEIELALGPNRALGERIVDQAGPEIEAARLTSAVYQALPKTAPVSVERRASLWRDRARIPGLPKVSAAAEDLAAEVYERCRVKVGRGDIPTLRECLATGHDRFVWGLNQAYWASVKRGY